MFLVIFTAFDCPWIKQKRHLLINDISALYTQYEIHIHLLISLSQKVRVLVYILGLSGEKCSAN